MANYNFVSKKNLVTERWNSNVLDAAYALGFVEELVYRYGNNWLLKTTKFRLNNNISFSNCITVS